MTHVRTIATAIVIGLISPTTSNLSAVMPTPVAVSYKHSTRKTPTLAERNIVIRALICAYALKYNVEPAAAMAVAHIESRKGQQEFRVGLMGRTYYGPFGVNKCFLKKWSVDELDTNIKVGVKALSRNQNLKKSLQKYNAAFNEAYWQAIQEARRKYRKGGVSG